MARPTKNHCDYFPHDCGMRNHKKIKAIRSKFGITGYSIWCMLLEHLTGSDGNVFPYTDLEFELMSGDFGVSATEIRSVVDYCILLELLFNKEGFVNSESLDERLLPVYEKRGKAKELSKNQLRNNGKFATVITDQPVVTVTEMPQSKVKETKEKKRKKKEITYVLPYQSEQFAFAWSEWVEYKKEKKQTLTQKTAEMQLRTLGARPESEAIGMIGQSIQNGWTGLFEFKDKQNGKSFTAQGTLDRLNSYGK